MTNLVEVEDFTLHSEEKRTSAFQLEVKTWLERHPDTQYVDILLNDLNGVFRGKRIPVSALPKLEKGCYFPRLGVCHGYPRQHSRRSGTRPVTGRT